VEALGDEHAEPISYGFKWHRPFSGTLRLQVRVRVDEELEIAVKALAPDGKPCSLDTTDTIAARESMCGVD
jgi:hypothetical protein